jgi:hypothetical protein
VSTVFERLDADRAKTFSQFALLPVLLLLREAAKSVPNAGRSAPQTHSMTTVSDRTVESALILVQTVAQRAASCKFWSFGPE